MVEGNLDKILVNDLSYKEFHVALMFSKTDSHAFFMQGSEFLVIGMSTFIILLAVGVGLRQVFRRTLVRSLSGMRGFFGLSNHIGKLFASLPSLLHTLQQLSVCSF